MGCGGVVGVVWFGRMDDNTTTVFVIFVRVCNFRSCLYIAWGRLGYVK